MSTLLKLPRTIRLKALDNHTGQLGDLAREAQRSHADAAAAKQAIVDLERSLSTARRDDAKAAGEAIRTGKKPPPATETRLLGELDTAIRSAEGYAAAARQAHNEFVAALRGPLGAEFSERIDEQLAGAATEIGDLLARVADTIDTHIAALQARDFLDRLNAHRDPSDPFVGRVPGVGAVSLTANVNGLPQTVGDLLAILANVVAEAFTPPADDDAEVDAEVDAEPDIEPPEAEAA